MADEQARERRAAIFLRRELWATQNFGKPRFIWVFE
jgi:hypothetical protein